MRRRYGWLLLAAAAAPLLAAPRAPLTVHHVGEYGGVPWGEPDRAITPGSREERVRDLNLAVSSINLTDDMDEAFLQRWARAARLGRMQGKAFLPRVNFWDGRDRFSTPIREIEVYWRRLDRFLGAMDLKDFHAVCLSEENVPYSGHAEVLDELYRRIKGKYDVPVYQWWDSAVPEHRIGADGWVVNFYYGGIRLRRNIQRYLLVGKPVVIMPYACWQRGDPDWPEAQWEALERSLSICREYNLPMAPYWTTGAAGRGTGCQFGMGPTHVFMHRINRRIIDWIAEVRRLPDDYAGLPSGEFGAGDVLEIGPDDQGRLSYRDAFDTSRFIEDASVEGFRDLYWGPDKRLALRSWRGRMPRAALIYRFAGDFPAGGIEAAVNVPFLAAGSRVSLAISPDGRQWDHPVEAADAQPRTLRLQTSGDPRYENLRAFFVRLEMQGERRDGTAAACVDDLRIDAKLALPATPAVRLRPDPVQPGTLAYEDDFQTRKYRYTTVRQQDENIEWERGLLAVRLRPRGTRASLIWEAVSPVPLGQVRAEVAGRANNGSLGTNHRLDLSFDGTNWLQEAATTNRPRNASGWAAHGLVVEGAAPPGVATRVYVRLRLETQGFKSLHPSRSGIINRIRIEGRPLN